MLNLFYLLFPMVYFFDLEIKLEMKMLDYTSLRIQNVLVKSLVKDQMIYLEQTYANLFSLVNNHCLQHYNKPIRLQESINGNL